MKSLCSQNTALLNAKECCRWTTSVFMYPKLPAQRAIWTAFYCLFARVCSKRARWYWQTNKDLLDENECGDPKDQSMKQRWCFNMREFWLLLPIIIMRTRKSLEVQGCCQEERRIKYAMFLKKNPFLFTYTFQ